MSLMATISDSATKEKRDFLLSDDSTLWTVNIIYCPLLFIPTF